MRIWSYTICRNEARLMPYYLKNYEDVCEKLFVYDDESDDGTRELLAAHPKVQVRRPDFVWTAHNMMRWANTVWKEARKADVDYVIVGDTDEFVHAEGGLEAALDALGRPAVVRCVGFEMVCDPYPTFNGRPLTEIVRHGERCPHWHDKCLVFSPRRVDEINYGLGCRQAAPMVAGKRFAPPQDNRIKMLHMKYLGREYVVDIMRLRRVRHSEYDKKHGLGIQYQKTDDQTRADFDALMCRAQIVI